MESGYFGPRDAWQYHPDNYAQWDSLNQEVHARNMARPNNIDLSVSNPGPKFQFVPAVQEDDDVVKYVRVGLGLAALITENLLCHPFVVLRRQCQVNHSSSRFHILPVTLFPIVIHLHQRQGITTLWKGIGSVLLIRGFSIGVEDLLSKITPWPKEISWSSSVPLKSMSEHIVLKCITMAIITPFYSASLVETVQSDVACDKPGIFDVFKEGLCRLCSWSYPKKGRMLPVWSLVIPTVMYGILRYLFHTSIKNLTSDILHIRRKQELECQGALPKDGSVQISQDIEVTAQLVSLVASDMLFYPMETILHRLHLQGTRTIIDNLDSGFSVTPILTNYEGTLDCYRSTVNQEGFSGLYKGFGALLLQFTAYAAVIKLTKFVLTQLSTLLRQPSQSNVPPPTPVGHISRQHSLPMTPVQPQTPSFTPTQTRQFPESFSRSAYH